MKKFTLAIAFSLACMSFGFAQSAENQPKAEASAPVSEEMKALETAYNLAEYGYANDSASALIMAAEILAQTPTAPLSSSSSLSKKEGTSATAESSTSVEYTVEQLLNDAKALYGKDKTMKAWAESVQKLVKSSTRGSVSGPYYDVDCASRNGRSFRYTISFYANSYGEVSVRSLDGCDYDLFIYDENGNLIDQDVSYSSNAYCSFVPRWTGRFTIVVKNRSRYAGRYQLTTN